MRRGQFFSWTARHPNLDGFGVRCDSCVGGWWADSHGTPILYVDRLDAERAHGRHDRHEHQLSSPYSQTHLGGG